MSHSHHSVDAQLRQVRADTLARIKGLLQPLFDNETISRDEFVAICKQTLQWAMSSAAFREAATQETLRPLIEAQLKAIGRPPMMPIAFNSTRALFPASFSSTAPRSRTDMAPLHDENGLLNHTKSHKRSESRTLRAVAAAQPVAVAPTAAAQSQAKDLMERYFLHDDNGLDDAPPPQRRGSLGNAVSKASEDDADIVDRSRGVTSTPRFASSCSTGPIDPEDLLYRQRQQRLAALRRQRQSTAAEESRSLLVPETSNATAQPASNAPSSSMDALAALLERHHAHHTALLQSHLEGMERRNTTLVEEHNERQFVALDEVAAWGLLLTSSDRDMHVVAHRERDRVERDEMRNRDEILQSETALIGSIQEVRAVELRSIEEAAEVSRHLDQGEQALDADLPPPPSTPKPAHQFESAPGNAEDDDGPTDAVEVQRAMLQRLKGVAAHLPPQQRIVVAERILALEAQLAKGPHEPSTAGHVLPHTTTTPQRRTMHREPSPEVAARRATTGRRGVVSMDPYAPVHAVSPHLLMHKTPTLRSTPSRSPGASRTPKAASMATGSQGLEKPNRAQVVEFLRRLLQPLYDSESLPRDMFVGIVKHISQKFFHNDQWLALAEKTVGKDTVAQHLRNPMRQPPLWQVYLHREVSDVVGEDVPL